MSLRCSAQLWKKRFDERIEIPEVDILASQSICVAHLQEKLKEFTDDTGHLDTALFDGYGREGISKLLSIYEGRDEICSETNILSQYGIFKGRLSIMLSDDRTHAMFVQTKLAPWHFKHWVMRRFFTTKSLYFGIPDYLYLYDKTYARIRGEAIVEGYGSTVKRRYHGRQRLAFERVEDGERLARWTPTGR